MKTSGEPPTKPLFLVGILKVNKEWSRYCRKVYWTKMVRNKVIFAKMTCSGWPRNRKPEPSEPFSQEPNAEPEPPEPFSRNPNRNRNRPLCETVLKHTKTPSPEEPPEPKTGTARTVPSPNRNRTEPNRGHPAYSELEFSIRETFGPFWPEEVYFGPFRSANRALQKTL